MVKHGRRNLIAVKVTNAMDLGIPPIYADFTFAGGIYRPVTIATTSPVHFEIGRDGWLGLQLDQKSVTAQAAEIDVHLSVANDTRSPTTAEVQIDVQDASGQAVASTGVPVELPAMRSATANVPLRITSPRRWHGLTDPYLYQAVATVRVNGVVVDHVARPLGLRSFRIDPDQGFLLNEQPYDLHGVGLHQDRIGKGWLISSEDRREDVALLRELGATFVRLAHYQHDQETYDLMDRAGIVVWAELPVLMQVGRGERFAPSAKAQLTGLIRQNAHHPSIVCWGLYNEIGSQPEDVALIRDLHALAKRLDPTRPTTAATYAADAAEVNHVTDVISFNKYFGWYLPRIDAFGPWADKFHATYPDRAVGLSEYGAGGSIRHHEEDPQPPVPGLAQFVPLTHSESYQTHFHQTVWPQLASRPFLWCKAAWVLCDFTSDQAKTRDAVGYNDKGLVTGDRKVRKDAFYYYKAQWSEQPMLHIVGRRFIERQPRVDLTIFSNQAQVQVRVNGKELPPVESAGRVFTWKGVELRRGENHVEASAPSPTGMLHDEVVWRVRK
jgi:beta-galactosidase